MIELEVTPQQALEALRKIKDEFVPIFSYALSNQMAARMLTLMQQFAPVKTGNLRSSLDVDKDPDWFWVGTHSVKYAKYVAQGTDKMPARPFHTWAYEKVSQEAPTMMLALIAKHMEKFGGELK